MNEISPPLTKGLEFEPKNIETLVESAFLIELTPNEYDYLKEKKTYFDPQVKS